MKIWARIYDRHIVRTAGDYIEQTDRIKQTNNCITADDGIKHCPVCRTKALLVYR